MGLRSSVRDIFNRDKPEAASWRVAASSVQGASHVKTGQVCQDAHAWQITPEGVLLAAVADGAGSAEWSQAGAQIAAQTACETLLAELPAAPREADAWTACLQSALQTAQARLRAEAEVRTIELDALASTLILLAAAPNLLVIAQIGDGAVVAQKADGSLSALTTPQNGEYVNTTTFLTSPNALATVQIVTCSEAVTHLAAFSDGLQRIALQMPAAAPYAPFFAPLFQFVAEEDNPQEAHTQLTAFLNSPRVHERTDDDITLFLAAALP